MAAGKAAELGANTLVLEKMDRPGRKIIISGKFRCNLTNTAQIQDFIGHFAVNGPFLRQAFHQFFSNDLVDFFNHLGVPTVVERGGRVFPKSGSSTDIVKALLKWCKIHNVKIYKHSPVEKILVEEGHVIGVKTGDRIFYSNKVIIATGGASYPGTGSTGDGYGLAENVGHSIIPIRPALVPLQTANNTAAKLKGLILKNVCVSVWLDGENTTQEFGEMIFKYFGISGPIILTMSRKVVDALEDGSKVEISIDLKPALDHRKLDSRLLRDFDNNGKKQFQTYLKELLPVKLIPVCLELTGIPDNKRCNQITAEERKRLRLWLKDFRLKIVGHRGFRHAIVTAGGVDTREIDPRSMESRLIRGLFFAGEIIDVDADTGGYNLQAAFSTGWLAGKSAAQ
jgi:predicted Rossmann fold flavoprotein